MYRANYHCHSHFCDGQGHPEEYILSAINKNMSALGFSCHSPVPFQSDWNMKAENLPKYLQAIKQLKSKYEERIKIYSGLEIDFVDGVSGINQYRQNNLDFSIGSVHFLGFFNDGLPWDFDKSAEWFKKGLIELFGGNIKKLVSHYYAQLVLMIKESKPDILGHFDLIKKFNRQYLFFDETSSWYRKIVFQTLEEIAKSGIILEINTRGMLKKLTSEFYPSTFILQRCRELKIPICLSSDAHAPGDVIALFAEATDLLKTIAFKETYILEKNGWSPTPIM